MIVPAYRALLWLAAPVALLITAAHSVKHRCSRHFPQRFGRRLPTPPAAPVLIHCASVGELRMGLALARAWHKKHPQQHILFTTATAASGRLYEQEAPPNTSHCYLPLDYPSLCKKFLDRVRPRCALIIETEIWLNLYRECGARHIPLLIVNARLSQKTLRCRRLIRGYLRRSLRDVTAILARNERDRAAYASLCATEKAETVGNLKYAPPVLSKALPNLIGRPYCLAASTHDNEESLAAQAWRRASTNGLLLVIAPRHIERSAKIARTLRRAGLRVALHSQAGGQTQDVDVCLYDSIGQLDALMKHARLVFLGGSLVGKGGHNLLEAARLGAPQVTGPHLDNVQEEARDLAEKDALLIVNDADELSAVFATAAKVETAYAEAAANALAHVAQQSDIAARYAERIDALCKQ